MQANTLDQLLDVAAPLAGQPAPSGRRVALVGNAGPMLATPAEGVSLGRSRPRLVLRPHCGFVERVAVQVVEEVLQTRRGEAHD